MLVIGAALGVGLVLVTGVAVWVLFALVFLPFRLLGWLLYIPFLLIKGVFGLLTAPFLLLGSLLTLAVVALTALPLLPIVVVALLVWVLVRASARPAAV
jgi:hypothetical protein